MRRIVETVIIKLGGREKEESEIDAGNLARGEENLPVCILSPLDVSTVVGFLLSVGRATDP